MLVGSKEVLEFVFLGDGGGMELALLEILDVFYEGL